jgi:hypothetical protein
MSYLVSVWSLIDIYDQDLVICKSKYTDPIFIQNIFATSTPITNPE